MTEPGPTSWTDRAAAWPPLPLDAWRDTYATLHMWTQIVGKIRLTLSAPINHWWHSTLYVTARGLTTSPIPYGAGIFELQFDFLAHELVCHVGDGETRRVRLAPRSVADFYGDVMAMLDALGIRVEITATPQELREGDAAYPGIPFTEDTTHASYDGESVTRFWRVLVATDAVLKEFRSRFIGKCSPVHFFWGGFDLAVTRFSGRPAPPMPEADKVTQEGYSHEVISVGFWPGGGSVPGPAFYSYTHPAPAGLAAAAIQPAAAFYNGDPGFLLMYDDMRESSSPRASLLAFAQSTYDAGATLAGWDRASLER